uniref:Uncharacterized protein n=1 Tax=Rhizophora mucronata TaxID=61149 RepID=A0A2P2R259_RHIMU
MGTASPSPISFNFTGFSGSKPNNMEIHLPFKNPTVQKSSEERSSRGQPDLQ